MISAFGVEHTTDISKGHRLEDGRRVRYRTKNAYNSGWFGEDYSASPSGKDLTAHIRTKKGSLKSIGEMTTNHGNDEYKPGEVEWISTKKKYRRQGLATSMFQHMEQVSPTGARHSKTQLPKGKKWAATIPDKYGGTTAEAARAARRAEFRRRLSSPVRRPATGILSRLTRTSVRV